MNAYSTVQNQTVAKPTFTPVAHSLLQRCTATTECAECRKKREGTLQRAAINSFPVNDVPPIVYDVLRSPGQPLDAETRAFMEPRFGHDFSSVRVHTDRRANQSARAVNALAYTVGRDVVFGAEQYSLDTREGRSLLAHELTHVVQQRNNGGSTGPLVVGSTDANEEREAGSAETIVNAGGKYNGPLLMDEPTVLRRQPPKSDGTAPSPKPTFSCLQDGTGRVINLASAVTVITYGAPAWCKPCLELDATLESICKNYKANSKFSVSFYTVDVDLPNADKTQPPATGLALPTTLIFSNGVKVQQFGGAKPASDIYPMINNAAAAAFSGKKPTPTPTPAPAPAPAPTPAPTPTPTGQACSFNIVGIDGNDTLENSRKYTDAEIAKGRAENPTATSDAQIRTITNGCPRQPYQLVINQQNARILHVRWKKEPPQPPGSTLSVTRQATDDGGDMPPGKARSVSTLNAQINKLPADCALPNLTDKPAWCVPFCSFGEFQMEVSVDYECAGQINTVRFGPKKITVKEKKP